jgi:molybdenum cofactor synthesis domain-containing protein
MDGRIKAAVITVSTSASADAGRDTAGPALCSLIEGSIGEIVHYSIVSDDFKAIRRVLMEVCDSGDADVAFTLGGTGLSPSDVTPEATDSVVDRLAPGISEAMRMKSLEKTSRAMLSRGTSGVRGRTLIINMPGSEKAVRESFEIVLPVLGHAVDIIHGRVKDCGRPTRG